MSLCAKNNLTMPNAMQNALAEGAANDKPADTFTQAMQLRGKAFRDVPGRKTLQFTLAGKSYFIKQHFGVGWREIFKNLLSFKMPILGALTEVKAIEKLDTIGIATTPLVAYGQRGCNPAKQQSFVITEDLGEIITVEELCADWQSKPIDFKQQLLEKMANLASQLHGAGLCHRDFYCCHFVLKKADLAQGHLHLTLIDLHRMLFNQSKNGSSVMKDISGLYFSAKQAGLSAEDLTLFKQHYLPQSEQFWQQVEARSERLLSKFNSAKFQEKLVKDRQRLS